MRAIRFIILTTLLLAGLRQELHTQTRNQGRLIQNPIRNIPAWVRRELDTHRITDNYKIVYGLYPYVITGDFNGDGRKDAAVQVRDNQSGKLGIVIVHGRKPQANSAWVPVLGAGKSEGAAGDDFTWADLWSKVRVKNTLQPGKKPRTIDRIMLQNKEGRTVTIQWNGKAYTAVRGSNAPE